MSDRDCPTTASEAADGTAPAPPPGAHPREDVAAAEALAQTISGFTPVPRAKERSNGWKPHVQRAFIEALAETGSVRAACRRVGRADHGAYLLRRHPQAASFRKAWDAALDLGVRRIEDAAMDRALYGTEETIHYHGQHVATRRRYNERLVMFILRNRAADRYGEHGAKGPDAIGRMELDRLKKQWRKEWEDERKLGSDDDEDAVIESINAKLDTMRKRWLTRLSPRTRAAYDEYRRLEREDEEAGYRCWDDPEHESYIDPSTRSADTATETPLPLPAPTESEREEEEDEDEHPRWRTIKDEGWE